MQQFLTKTKSLHKYGGGSVILIRVSIHGRFNTTTFLPNYLPSTDLVGKYRILLEFARVYIWMEGRGQKDERKVAGVYAAMD